MLLCCYVSMVCVYFSSVSSVSGAKMRMKPTNSHLHQKLAPTAQTATAAAAAAKYLTVAMTLANKTSPRRQTLTHIPGNLLGDRRWRHSMRLSRRWRAASTAAAQVVRADFGLNLDQIGVGPGHWAVTAVAAQLRLVVGRARLARRLRPPIYTTTLPIFSKNNAQPTVLVYAAGRSLRLCCEMATRPTWRRRPRWD